MYLHIVQDDNFTSYAIKRFSKYEGHEFICLSTQRRLRCSNKKVRRISWLNIYNPLFLNKLKKYKMVFIHCLCPIKQRLILNSSEKIIFFWIGWGGDLYPYLVGYQQYLPNSLEYIKKYNCEKRKSELLSNIVKKMVFPSLGYYAKVLAKISYFAPVIESEFFLLKEYYPSFSAKLINWNYCSLEDLLEGVVYSNRLPSNDWVLVGNSGSYTNNHVDILNRLIYQWNVEYVKLIIPISYGASERYKIKIKEVVEGYRRVELIEKFMSLHNYTKLLFDCKYAIFGHLRQEALANIVVLLFAGCKVFMNSKSPLYIFLKNKGIYLYAFDYAKGLGMPMKYDEVLENRRILSQIWSDDCLDRQTQEIVELVS